jgi:hypothetical protein
VFAYDVLRRVLSDRPIAFHPELARAFGGINEALFFQQIAYWWDKGDDPEWIYKSQVELETETCLSAYQQKQARDHLKRLGALQDERRGVPALLYYRIDWAATFRVTAGTGVLVRVRLEGEFAINAGGTLIPQIRFPGATGSTPTVGLPTWFECKMVGPNPVTTIGP